MYTYKTYNTRILFFKDTHVFKRILCYRTRLLETWSGSVTTYSAPRMNKAMQLTK